MKPICCLVLLSLVLPVGQLCAQYHNDPIPEHETFTIQSERLGESRMINVWFPNEYITSSEPLPVLYMPDGGVDEDFPHVANTLADLIREKKIEPLILVGVENTQRRRDMSGPTNVEKDKEIAPVVGGSEQFRAFIGDELFAEIDRRYRIADMRGIIGESLAGLFITETLLLKPCMFDFYIAFDPSLWWNDRYLIKTACEYLDSFPGSPKVFWFAGSNTEQIFENVADFALVLEESDVRNLYWKYSPEPDENHGTIYRAAKEEALIWTLETIRAVSDN